MWSTLAKKNENDKIYWTRNLDEMESVCLPSIKSVFLIKIISEMSYRRAK